MHGSTPLTTGKICANGWCKTSFEVTEDDLAFYDKVSPVFGGKKYAVPPPELCPDCRQMRRMSFRNERFLYRRPCDRTQKAFLSIYDTETPFPVYSHEAWWSDAWDARSYGRDYDPQRQFFEQFQELFNAVPRLGIVTGHNENCDYCNYTNYSKDSYLCFGCHSVDRCYHNWRVHWSEQCVDCLQMDRSKYCYQCIDCESCDHLLHSQDCENCSASSFLYDCKGCKDCIGCSGLRNAQYCLFNKQLDRAFYEQERDGLALHTRSGIEHARKRFREFLKSQPHRAVFIMNSEEVRGDHIAESKNLHECYHVKHAQDCRYLESCEEIKDSMDSTFSGWPAELVLETMSAGVQCHSFLYCTTCWSCSNLLYCDSCHHSSDLFGCIGLRNHYQYCILNKQYTKEEYEKIVPSIIENMIQRGEWAKFFPATLSPHAYNETAAQEFYPTDKSGAAERGYLWKVIDDSVPQASKTIPAAQLPEAIGDIPDDILHWAVACEATGRPFKIIRQELDFYRDMKIPVPHLHPDERHRQRMALRNPRKLWNRTCGKCGKEMETTYSPDRKETVYCEGCYLKEVY